jgi:hypothetical protein
VQPEGTLLGGTSGAQPFADESCTAEDLVASQAEAYSG